MTRLARFVVVGLLAVLALPMAASAAERMLIGFQDDPSFRWRDDRQAVLDEAQRAGAGILRTTVYWYRIAQTRPSSPTNPNDPAYQFGDLDEFVRAATLRGAEVMLTIWGTPSWANGGKGQNFAPTRAADLTNFARAVAARYNGSRNGLPFVRYFTVWNESNLGQFLSPQYDARGRPVGAAVYARLYRAAYAGIKAGNRRALVGVGETSARGRDRMTSRQGQQQSQSPGRFAQLLSLQRPAIRFDAWSHHPYPTEPNLSPLQNVRWPNVTMKMLPRFGEEIDKWYKRKEIPIWITEYAHETKPDEPKGVTLAQQSSYMRTAINMARDMERVKMFIWFILRDDPTSTWQSGLLHRSGARKQAFATFSSLARLLDGRNPFIELRAGVRNPQVRVPVLEIYGRVGPGTRVGINMSVYDGNRVVGTSQPEAVIANDGWITVLVPITTVKRHYYRAYLQIGDASGNQVSRAITIFVP